MDATDPLGLLGKTVGQKFEVESLIHLGGFSAIYKAAIVDTGQEVALKILVVPDEAPDNARAVLKTNFNQAGRVLARLAGQAAGMVQARATGVHILPDGTSTPYIALEWLDGLTLEEILDQERDAYGQAKRSLREVYNVLGEPMEAIADAHELDIAHGDIKPGNLFVCDTTLQRGVLIKVIDFSHTRELGPSTQRKQEIEIMFLTPSYGSPEQFAGNKEAIGPWTDVFGMALIIVELMIAAPALEGTEVEELAAASQDPDKRPTPRARGLGTSDAIEAVFQRALAVDPQERYPNMREFLDALRNAMVEEARGGADESRRSIAVSGEIVQEETVRAPAPDAPTDDAPGPKTGTVVAPAPMPPDDDTDTPPTGTAVAPAPESPGDDAKASEPATETVRAPAPEPPADVPEPKSETVRTPAPEAPISSAPPLKPSDLLAGISPAKKPQPGPDPEPTPSPPRVVARAPTAKRPSRPEPNKSAPAWWQDPSMLEDESGPQPLPPTRAKPRREPPVALLAGIAFVLFLIGCVAVVNMLLSK